MRKRTQLVGFEFGYWKHAQYVAEFLDNALDAIESFQWKELKKEDSNLKFTLDQEISLENLSILQRDEGVSDKLNDEAKHMLMQEIGIEPSERESISESAEPAPSPEALVDKKEIEVEEEVKTIIRDMESLTQPVENIIDKEPIVIIRITEYEAPHVLTGELSAKNVMSYRFEIFDNGLGMAKIDLKRFGKYLASSKSMELKQTRGSQGFGAPSAFSDAQNTTGKPVVTVSKSAKQIYGTVSEFFTTSKNKKRYVIPPTDIETPFLHGTYVKLHYLNSKYVRGYSDVYIRETALLNSHITIVFIDPYNEEHIYPRKVSQFPEEPTYAKPHPSSTNIGDLQDLLGKSENLTISAFLQDNFVRISYNVAKEILDIAERDLQDNLNLLILKDGFLRKAEKRKDDIYFGRIEKRVYGRSNKPRDKFILYEVKSDEIEDKYWKLLNEYNSYNDENEKIEGRIKKKKSKIEKADTKKEKKKLKKDIRGFRKDIDKIREQKDKIRNDFNKIFKDLDSELDEVKDKKKVNEYKELAEEVQLSEARPNDLTNEQFNSLFLAFKSVKYMSPPTDTVVPVGSTVLENTLIKELGLRVSENLDDFGIPKEEITQLKNELIKQEKKKLGEKEASEEISIKKEELINVNSRILSNMLLEKQDLKIEGLKTSVEEIIAQIDVESKDEYKRVYEYFVENITRKDDFAAAETRDPTSGKGLAYVVEAVMAYSNKLEVPRRSRDVLSRFVNRTPKLRDNADCAITKAAQAVNWKNYNLDTYDNNLPKGPIKLLINVSGPYVHLMFKSQSKNALAEDESLIKEIKYCLEAIGRRLRVYLNRRAKIRKKEKRANLIEQYIPKFVQSLYNIAEEGSKYREKISKEELEALMRDSIRDKKRLLPQPLEPEEEGVPEKRKEEPEEKKKEEEKAGEKETVDFEGEEVELENLDDLTVKELKSLADREDIEMPSRARKAKIVKTIQKDLKEEEEEKEEEIPEEKEIVEFKGEEIELENLDDLTIKELKSLGDKKDIDIPSRARKDEIINILEKNLKEKKPKKEKEEGESEKQKETIEFKGEVIELENLDDLTVKELKILADKEDIEVPSRARKAKIVRTIQKDLKEEDEEEKEEIPEEKEIVEFKGEEIEFENLDDLTVKELRKLADKKDIYIPYRLRKDEIIDKITEELKREKPKEKPQIDLEKVKEAKRKLKERKQQVQTRITDIGTEKKRKAPPTPPKGKETTTPAITTKKVMKALSEDEWQTIKHLIFKLRIKDMMDARYLQIKLKELVRKDKILMEIKKGKKHWKLKE
ncbi:MAG: DNA topoisomerase VI, subunit B [Promethearchaeota archaeon]|nr:MAG: DNA topoisomerase VI, subunit B [Candidatus Lokiarchaeota archaeon]